MYSVTVGVFIFLGIDNDIPFRFKYVLAVYVEAFVNEVIKCMEFAFKKKLSWREECRILMKQDWPNINSLCNYTCLLMCIFEISRNENLRNKEKPESS